MSKQFRSDLPAWVLFGGLVGFLWLIVWVNAAHGIDWPSLSIASVVSTFAFAWLISFRIVITPTELIFRSLFVTDFFDIVKTAELGS